MLNLFGGKDPFDDPFFTQPPPFDDMFYPKTKSGRQSKEVAIEELDSDENPVDRFEPRKELVALKNSNAQQGFDSNGSKSFSYQRVSYGGLNGMYYTASITRKRGDDGVALMEINEEDKTVGQALSTVSRGIQNKGHSVTTKRTSDGKVDTLQTLHNLYEDELESFEENWKANAQKLPDDSNWKGGFNLLNGADAGGSEGNWWPTWGGWALPPTVHSPNANDAGAVVEAGSSSRRKAKKVVPVNIE